MGCECEPTYPRLADDPQLADDLRLAPCETNRISRAAGMTSDRDPEQKLG